MIALVEKASTEDGAGDRSERSPGRGVFRTTAASNVCRRVYTGAAGSSLIELALLTPLFLLMLAGAVDLGQACYVAIELSTAANAGAEYGTQNPTDTSGMQKAAVLSAANLTGISTAASTGCECSDGTSPSANCASTPSCGTTLVTYVLVTTSMNYVPVVGLPGLPPNYHLQGSARLRAAS